MRLRDTGSLRIPRHSCALTLALLLAGAAWAAPPPDTIPPEAMPQSAHAYRDDGFEQGNGNFRRPPLAWNQLNPSQRAFLKPLRSQWDTLPPWRQRRMAEHVEQWRQLPPDRQAQIQQRFERLAQMTPEQRLEAARGERNFQAMTPADRQRVAEAYQHFQSLTPEQRRALFQRFRQEREARQRMQDPQRQPPPR